MRRWHAAFAAYQRLTKKTVIHPSTDQARRRVTSLMRQTPLLLLLLLLGLLHPFNGLFSGQLG